jgi:von Willebrand factor type A domain
MTPKKISCPGCQHSLTVLSEPPITLRCPRCQTRFRVFADGNMELRAPKSAAANLPPRMQSELVPHGPAGSTLPALPNAGVATDEDPLVAMLEPAPSEEASIRSEDSASRLTGTIAPPPLRSEDSAPRLTERAWFSALPKPVFFGLHGALGGLLGALILGELLWTLLRPAESTEPPLQVAVSASVTVYPGGQNKLVVKVARPDAKRPVFLEVADPPRDVKIPLTIVPADESDAEIEITAEATAKLDTHELTLRAYVQDAEETVVSESFRLSIELPPPTLYLAVAPTVTVYGGYQNRVPIRIVRQNLTGPVRLSALNPPEDVTVEPATVAAKESVGELKIAARKARADDGPPRTVLVRVHGHAVNDPEKSATEAFTLVIEPPPPTVQLAVSPAVTVYPGDKNRVGVKIARQRFRGPVRIEAKNAPPGVTIASAVIAEGATEAELDIAAGTKALDGALKRQHQVQLQATAVDAPAPPADATLQVNVEPPPPFVQLAASPALTVYAGDKNRIGVKIIRQRFEGPVRIEAVHPPTGITVPPAVIPADATEADVDVHAAFGDPAGAPPRAHSLTVRAKAVDAAATPAEVSLSLQVLTLPAKLQLAVSPQVKIFQSGKCRFTAKIARTGYDGPVRLAFGDLPGGIAIPETVIAAGRNECVVEGDADLRAAEGKAPVQVRGVGANGTAPLATAQFMLDVHPADPAKLPPPLDIVFVLDVTGSMTFAINGVRDGIQKFVDELARNRLEAQVGMLAFKDEYEDRDAFNILTFGANKHFTKDALEFSKRVGSLKADGGGDTPESSLDAMIKAAKLPFRSNSVKILLLITDAPYKEMKDVANGQLRPKPNHNPATILQTIKALKEKKINQVHLITKQQYRPLYEPLQNGLSGSFFDLDNAAKGGNEFASLLPKLSQAIAKITVAEMPAAPLAEAPPALPPAEAAPAPPKAAAPRPPTAAAAAPPKAALPPPPLATLEVQPRLAAVPPPPAESLTAAPSAAVPQLQGVQSTQAFAEEDRLQLLLAIALWTAALAGGICLTLAGGQKLYLQQSWLGLADAAKALAVGLGAGALAGIVGQSFFQFTTVGPSIVVISRVLAWTLLGGLLGAGLGFAVPNLKWQRALLGGCLGGLVGALGFTACSLVVNPMLGRFLGAALLGFCIGLMIALAEIAFRRYWLEITYGAREVRTVTLGTAAVSVGGDAAAAVFIAGAPPIALRYRVEQDQVLAEDAATGTTTPAAPGESRQIAGVRVAVCSAASARGVGMTLQLSSGKTLALTEGMPLTPEDLPGLDPQAADGIVALISRRPSDPQVLLLRNRSKQTWTVTGAAGMRRTIEPGLGTELTAGCNVDFGVLRGVISVS